jgi:hypothetical protein
MLKHLLTLEDRPCGGLFHLITIAIKKINADSWHMTWDSQGLKISMTAETRVLCSLEQANTVTGLAKTQGLLAINRRSMICWPITSRGLIRALCNHTKISLN